METRLSDIDLFQVYKNCKNGLDDFQCFVRSTNFVSLKHYPDFCLSPIPDNGGVYVKRVSSVIQNNNSCRTLFLLDINGTDAIKTAYWLRKFLSIASIPVYNGVLHPNGLVGDEEYISCLINYCINNDIKKDAIEDKVYMFVFDSNRFGDYSDEELKENFNNQYELGEDDLPPVEMLEILQYKKIVYIYDRDIKEDLNNYLEYLSQAKIEVEKVNIAETVEV